MRPVRLQWPLFALLVLAAPLAARSQEQAPKQVAPEPCPVKAQTVKYDFLLVGKVAGEQTSTQNADGSWDYCFEFNDRGRGPRLLTHTVFGQDHVPTAIDTTGYDYLKGAAAEHFAIAQQTASWKNKAEDGQKRLAAPAYFVGMSSPPEDLATLAAALIAAPDHSLALLPEGEAHLEPMGELKVSAGGRAQTVRAYGVSGLSFSPNVVWLDDAGRFFAMASSWSSVVRAGWMPVLGDLLKAQDAATDRRNAALARSLAHHAAGPLAIEHARLFDATTAASRPNTTVVITGERITAVGPDGSVAIPAGAEVLDAHGQALLPGLWDMHVHVGDDDGLLNVANGVTSVRDLGNDPDKVTALRRDWDEGRAIGPRILLAGLIDGSGPYAGPTKALVDTPEQARAAIERFKSLGYVQIKIYSSIKPELVPAIAGDAHKLGMRVSGHVPAFMTAADCVRDGYDEIQHANFLFLNFMFDKVKDTRGPARFTAVAENAAALDLDSQPVRDFIALLRQHHTVSDPTVSIFEDMFTQRPGQMSPGYVEIADRLPAQVRRGFLASGLTVPDGMDQRYRDSFQAMLNLVKRLYDSGITIVAGTDSLGGFTLHRELENYVRAGIPAPQVLQLDTLGAAQVMKRDAELGSIEPGKLADMILVDGDPAANIADIRRVETIFKGGVRYQAADLDRALGVKPVAFADAPPAASAEAAQAAAPPAHRHGLDPARLVDLTYTFDEQTIYWPTAKPFAWQKEAWGINDKGYWYAAGRYSASEHGGTHLDSPIHFAQGRETADEIPVSRLVAPVLVVDISAACAKDPDYRLSAADLTGWEKEHGAIPPGAIVLVHTGWGKYWPDKKRYLGSDTPGDVANLHFPGIGREAAGLLVARGISGVGIDTASMDYGQSRDFIAHQLFNGAGIYGLENVANLEKVPATGATLIALPMKIKGGSGAPARIVALLP